ncbi:hypothetical protein ACIQC9_06965 [Brevundimonas sp. NPDC092305]|uniref:hypothetical protein n=1 Tax=Brevundimonas sp. NPDC092305 TaxID=3363957 RepID=UPI00382E6D4F
MNRSTPGVIALLLIASPQPVAAQDFLGGLARRAAEQAAQAVVGRAVTAATAPRPPASARPAAAASAAPSASAPQAPAAAGGLPADFPAPRPLNYSADIRRPGQLRFSDAEKNAKGSFDQIGRYACASCEGGFNFDSWPRHEVRGIGVGNYQLENRLGALGVGEALTWTGSHTGTRYAITVTSDRAIGPWPCKQLRWTGDRGDEHVERVGLICKPGDNWHELV